jgi:hypothetical protein
MTPRTGPRMWVVVALTLGAVVVLVLTFLGGLVTGVVVAGRSLGAGPVGPVLGSDPPSPDGGSSGGGGSGVVEDQCLVGTWRTVEHTESANTEQGNVTISGVDRTLTITKDGTETITYGSRPAKVAMAQGEATAVFDGKVVYDVRAGNGKMSFRLRSVEGTLTLSAGGGQGRTEELKPGTGDVSYTCSGDRFVQEASGYRSVMERQ